MYYKLLSLYGGAFMFAVTFNGKKNLKKIIFISAAALLLTAAVIMIFFINSINDKTAKFGEIRYSTVIENTGDIEKLADFFGLKIEPEPETTEEITIPLKFNDVYEHYNIIQNTIGLDLSRYRGKKSMKYTYKVKSDIETDDLVMTVLICDERLIGADLSDREFKGRLMPLSYK